MEHSQSEPLSRNGSATSMLSALQFWCRGRWPQRAIHIRHAAIALAIIVSTDAETHRAAPASALVVSKLRHGRFIRNRVGCAALHSLSPPSFHLHLRFHSGVPRQVHCPVLRRKVITSVWNVKGTFALRVPPFFASLQNGYHPCLISPSGGTLGAV